MTGRTHKLARLEDSAQEHLRRLQDPSADRDVILRLLETSCLLELSKLTAAQVDLATFVAQTVEVLVQFFPVDGCAVVVEPEGLPRAAFTHGTVPLSDDTIAAMLDADTDPDGDVMLLRLNALMQPIGHVVIAGLPSFITDRSFFARAADQLSAVLGAMVAAERLRRDAAQATALQLAATLDQGADDEQLQALVEALAALPGASGAHLVVDHPALGAPTKVAAGVGGREAATWATEVDSGSVNATLFAAEGRPSQESLRKVVEILAGTLRRMHQGRRLQEEVETDPLTGAGNRRRASRRLASALARAERTGGTVAVLALDLDHFKAVNDTLGHQTGDAVLQAFTNMLFEHTRAYDTVARMGGEEFTILLPGLDVLEARSVAERIIDATPRACSDTLGSRFRQTVSVGIALFPEHAEFGDGLLRTADAALYEAKRLGRNRAVVAGAAQRPAVQRRYA